MDRITQHRDLGLRMFELSDHEWEVLEKLHNVLKVSGRMLAMCYIKQTNKQIPSDSQTCYALLLAR